MKGWNVPLSAGMHLVPEDGACLMEAVSAATGERWTDSPSSTHPLLAHLARLVNDTIGDESRHELAAFIPELVDANSTDPRVAARIAVACASRAIDVHDGLRLRLLRHLASRRLDGSRVRSGRTLEQRLFERGTARVAVEMSVSCCARAGDRQLVMLLAAAVAAVKSESRSVVTA